ncbi:MAG: hypothetical protein RLZZ455_929 [Candidatus Parcubacteria bacterium]|jgi:tRNA threonylcarbamoyladenosine biosynthesis protein TsaB
MISLIIDTSNSLEIIVSLERDGKKDEMHKRISREQPQEVLVLLDALLKKNNLALSDISEIIVRKGPGSYTGLRVGASVANTLAYLLNIPINRMPVGKRVTPVYS